MTCPATATVEKAPSEVLWRAQQEVAVLQETHVSLGAALSLIVIV